MPRMWWWWWQQRQHGNGGHEDFDTRCRCRASRVVRSEQQIVACSVWWVWEATIFFAFHKPSTTSHKACDPQPCKPVTPTSPPLPPPLQHQHHASNIHSQPTSVVLPTISICRMHDCTPAAPAPTRLHTRLPNQRTLTHSFPSRWHLSQQRPTAGRHEKWTTTQLEVEGRRLMTGDSATTDGPGR
jgi:hypothetical protein